MSPVKYNTFVLSYCDEEMENILTDLKNNNYKPLKTNFESETKYLMHKFAFHNEYRQIIDIYISDNDCDIDTQDEFGNTSLMIAAMKGHIESLKILTFLNANILLKNKEGWTALHESISYGNVNQVSMLLRLFKQQNEAAMIEKKLALFNIEESRDFIIDFKWIIETWMPLLSRFLPSDNCTLIKTGKKLRLNSTLLDFNNRSWSRGNLTCLINPELTGYENCLNTIFIINHDKKIYQLLPEDDATNLMKEVALLMSTEIVDPSLELSSARYEEKMKSWPFASEKMKQQVGEYEADLYELLNVKMVIKKRKEHLTGNEIRDQKLLTSKIQSGCLENINSLKLKLENKPIPPDNNVTWEDYEHALLEQNSRIDIGRVKECKLSVKDLRLVVGMTEDFPLKPSEIIDVLEIVLPLKRFTRLREIFSTTLPKGFPVYVEVPVYPTVTARVHFEHAKVGSPKLDIDYRLFEIPKDYKRVRNILK